MARILIADDDAHIVRVMSIWLDRHGYDTVTVRNGVDALATIDQGGVDLVITDMNMPLLDGRGLVRKTREHGHTDLPLLLMTARCDQEGLIEQLSAYDVHVFPKPFVPSKLVEEIDRLLRLVSTRESKP